MKRFLKKTITVLALGITLASHAPTVLAATYSIEKGDTFWYLSQSNGIPLTSILAANPTADPLNLQIGQYIEIPDSAIHTFSQQTNTSIRSNDSAPSSSATAKSADRAVANQAASQSATFTASAYTASPSENGPWGAKDYYGNPLKIGTIAVDPAVIPLGSYVYVSGYSFTGLPPEGMLAQATDIGGAVKGNHIDIFVPVSSSQARKFGIQQVQVRISKTNPAN